MNAEQRLKIDTLKEQYPARANKIESLLSFIGGLGNPNVWNDFLEQLEEALASNDEHKLQLLEGLQRRMKGILTEPQERVVKKRWIVWLAGVSIIALIFAFLIL